MSVFLFTWNWENLSGHIETDDAIAFAHAAPVMAGLIYRAKETEALWPTCDPVFVPETDHVPFVPKDVPLTEDSGLRDWAFLGDPDPLPDHVAQIPDEPCDEFAEAVMDIVFEEPPAETPKVDPPHILSAEEAEAQEPAKPIVIQMEEAAKRHEPHSTDEAAEMKRLRSESGLSQKQFGIAIGVSADCAQSRISNIEHGRARPTPSQLETARQVRDRRVKAHADDTPVGRPASDFPDPPTAEAQPFATGEAPRIEQIDPSENPGRFLARLEDVVNAVRLAAEGKDAAQVTGSLACGLREEHVRWLLFILTEDVEVLWAERTHAGREMKLNLLRGRLKASLNEHGYLWFGGK